VNLVSDCTFPSPRILSRPGALHAVPHSLTVACTYPSLHYHPLTSITPVLPNLSLIPNKHHVFINPPLRRVYLGDRVDNNKAVINDLKSKIVCLEARIATLESGNRSTKRELVTVCLMLDKAKEYVQLAQDEAKKETQLALDKVNADAQLALRKVEKEARLARDKANKDAQLALDKANDDLRLANLSLEECRAENNSLKSQWVTHNFLR
jgi:hypothetical protein